MNMDPVVVILSVLCLAGFLYAIFSDFGVRGWKEALHVEEDRGTIDE